jgi:hypothetical protein
MRVMVRLKTARSVAWLMMMVVAVPYLSSAVLAAEGTVSSTQTVLAFPFDSPSGKSGDQAAKELGNLVAQGLMSHPGYSIIQYSQQLPAVKRLMAMQSDKRALIGPWSTDTKKAVTLAKDMSADMLLVGSIDSYTFAQNGKVEIIASVTVLDAKTGETVRTIALTSKAVAEKAADKSVDEAEVASRAVKDAASKILKDLGADMPVVEMQSNADKSKKKNSSWLVVLLAVGAGLLLGGGSGGSSDSGGSGSGLDTPPGFGL